MHFLFFLYICKARILSETSTVYCQQCGATTKYLAKLHCHKPCMQIGIEIIFTGFSCMLQWLDVCLHVRHVWQNRVINFPSQVGIFIAKRMSGICNSRNWLSIRKLIVVCTKYSNKALNHPQLYRTTKLKANYFACLSQCNIKCKNLTNPHNFMHPCMVLQTSQNLNSR